MITNADSSCKLPIFHSISTLEFLDTVIIPLTLKHTHILNKCDITKKPPRGHLNKKYDSF